MSFLNTQLTKKHVIIIITNTQRIKNMSFLNTQLLKNMSSQLFL